jgi:hypothetical protein
MLHESTRIQGVKDAVDSIVARTDSVVIAEPETLSATRLVVSQAAT